MSAMREFRVNVEAEAGTVHVRTLTTEATSASESVDGAPVGGREWVLESDVIFVPAKARALAGLLVGAALAAEAQMPRMPVESGAGRVVNGRAARPGEVVETLDGLRVVR
jgi:hypothetical protein